MILHVSAERTNATILSIPRDTVAERCRTAAGQSGNISLTGYVQPVPDQLRAAGRTGVPGGRRPLR